MAWHAMRVRFSDTHVPAFVIGFVEKRNTVLAEAIAEELSPALKKLGYDCSFDTYEGDTRVGEGGWS